MGWNILNTFRGFFKSEERSGPECAPKKPFYTHSGTDKEFFIEENILHNLLHGHYAGANFINLFYCLPEVFAPVHEIASRVSDAKWELCKTMNDEVDYKNEQFNRLFEQPNPLLTFKDFVYQAVCYEICTGRQLFYKNAPDALVLSGIEAVINWWNLPYNTQIRKKPNVDTYSATSLSDFIEKYEGIDINSQRNREFKTANVFPIVHMDLRAGNDLCQPASMLLGAEKAIKNLIPVYAARGLIYLKRGALGILVNKNQDAEGTVALTKTEKEEILNEYQNTYGVTGDRNPLAITSVPMDFVRTAMSISELQPFDETLQDAVSIYATLRVPRHLVPSKDRSTYANADADMKSFYSDVVIPWAERYAQAWTIFFKLDEIRRYIRPNYKHAHVLQENRKEAADVDKINGSTYLQAWLHGACTLNDWRVARGDEKIGGNIYEKTVFELTPEEVEQVKNILNIKSNATPENTGSEKEGATTQQARA